MSEKRTNQVKAKAADNRAALLTAAAHVFAEGGLDAPLSAVAKRAGVGQGSLYRHFPNRESLAFAALESGVADLESLGSGRASLSEVLAAIASQAGASATFMQLIARDAADPRSQHLEHRLRRVLHDRIDDGRSSGVVPPAFSVDDLIVSVMLMTGGLMSTLPKDRPDLVKRGWELLGINLAADPT